MKEKVQYITPDGIKYTLDSPPVRSLINIDGLGLSTNNFRTTRGPFQHGETVLSNTLTPRTITLTFRHNGHSRSNHWNYRANLIDVLRSNRTSDLTAHSLIHNPEPGQLRFIYYVDKVRYVRDIDVYLTGGVSFKSPSNWDNYSIQEDIQFTAYNPVFYNPTQHSQVLAVGAQEVVNAGTWDEFPTVVVAGAFTDFGLVNGETGYYFVLAYTAAGGETVTIDLKAGNKRIYNQLGANLISYLSLSSQLVNFALHPDPIAPSGSNTITAATTAGAPTMTLYWYDRYAGL